MGDADIRSGDSWKAIFNTEILMVNCGHWTPYL